MKRSKQLFAISCCALILSGCTTSKEFISLPETVINKIESTDVYLEQCSKELQADVESSNLTTYTGGVMLVALVDSAIVAHREDKAKDAMIDIQRELQSFNVHDKFREKITRSLQNTNWLHVRSINCINDLNNETLEAIIKNEKSDSILTVRFNYRLNPKMTVLKGTAYLILYPSSHKMQ